VDQLHINLNVECRRTTPLHASRWSLTLDREDMRQLAHKTLNIAACVLVSWGTLLAQDAPIITSFTSDGRLTWKDAPTNGIYRVEWTSSLSSHWRKTWDSLDHISATGTMTSVEVPMFFRVVRLDIQKGTDGNRKIVTLDLNQPTRSICASSGEPPAMCATLDGVVFQVKVERVDSSSAIQVGSTVKYRATVKPPDLPGTFIWYTPYDTLSLDNSMGDMITARAVKFGRFKVYAEFLLRPTIDVSGVASKQTKVAQDALCGNWRSTQAPGIITINRDGTWVEQEGPTKLHSGTWRVRDNAMVWIRDLDAHKREDVNPVLQQNHDRFILQEMDGAVTVFTRASPNQQPTK